MRVIRRKRDGKLFTPHYPPEWDDIIVTMRLAGVFLDIPRASAHYFVPVERAPKWQFWRRWRIAAGTAWEDAQTEEFEVIQ